MNAFRASYYDGEISQRHAVEAAVAADRLWLRGDGVELDYPLSVLVVAPRIAHTPRRIGLPDGGQCETADNDAVDRSIHGGRRGSVHRLQHRLESRPSCVLAALLLVVGIGWGMIEYGVPWLAQAVAIALPRDVDQQLGRGAIDTLDRLVFEPSRLAPARHATLRQRFAELTAAARLGAPVDQVPRQPDPGRQRARAPLRHHRADRRDGRHRRQRRRAGGRAGA